MNTYQWISVILTGLAYIPLGHHILSGKAKQNLATWVLWVILDAIVAGSILAQHGNFQLPLFYVFGGTCIVLCIAKMKIFEWTRYETFIAVLVFACMYGWWVSGPWFATIFSSLAVAVATWPQFGDVWEDPADTPIVAYAGFGIADIFSVLGGKAWTVEERFYPIVCICLCAVIVILSMRKFYRSESPSY